jgi:glutaryl-CoA dehydrogenase
MLVGDLYGFQDLLAEDEAAVVRRVRDFLAAEVVPIANDLWARAEFPHHLIKKYADLDVASGAGSSLLKGWLALEMADVAAGLQTTARRDGDTWILNGAKRWIGNATFADLIVVWARSEEDNQVKGFVVRGDAPGLVATKIENKIALRITQNADITLADVRVPEADRLQNADSFKDTAKVLRQTRSGVAWEAVGVMLAAYEIALGYARERTQFGKPIASFQLVQDLLVRMVGNVTASLGMCVRLAQLQDAGRYRDEHSALAKAYCTTRMREVVGWARELLAGNGIVLDYDIGRFVADAEALYSYEGTREINTLIVGRAVTGQSAFV